MKSRLWFLWLAVAVSARPSVAAPPAETLGTLKVPPGFTVELATDLSLVEHPIMGGFDELGRLYVAENAGLNLPAEELEAKLPNSIRRLEDTNGDGRFDRGTTFADKMTFPQGAVWFRGSVYVASPPSIWKLTDTDDDGVADQREELVGKFGFNGNAADIHGCFVTPAGRIAWCDGRHGHEFKDTAGSTTSQGLAARIFTCRPDGSDVETFAGGGMDNPVELAFTREGEPLGTMTFYNPDEARHDALVHYVFGGVYPRKHPCTSEFKRTGGLMPAVSRFGVTAPSGLARFDHPGWGEEYRDNLFSTHFNTHKVVRHILKREGATFSSTDEDFLVSTSPDFHPTDIIVDADGSLLVIDTGGWFRIGCPTSQVAKPEIGGAIYRIRRTGTKPVDDPRGLKIEWETTSDTEMADLLYDPRPAVVERAIEFLVPRGDAAMGALATGLFDSTDYRDRQNAMWALARIGTENARLLLRQGLSDDDMAGRLAAVQAVGDLRDAESILPLIDRLLNDEPPVRREAATALGRLGRADAVPAILKALAKPIDRFEEHALIFALIQINDRKSTSVGLNDASPAVRRAVLVALDQMDAGNLSRDDVSLLLSDADGPLLDAIVEVLSRHPEWSDELKTTIRDLVALRTPDERQLAMLRGAVAALAARPAIQQIVCEALTDETADSTRLAILEGLAGTEPLKKPKAVLAALAQNLSHRDDAIARQTVITLAALGCETLPDQAPGPSPFTEGFRINGGGGSDPLLALGLDARRPAELRVLALRQAARSHCEVPLAAFALLTAQAGSAESLRDRLAAAEALGSFRLSRDQCREIVPLVAAGSPLEVASLLRAFKGNRDRQTGEQLVAALRKSSATATIPAAQLREALASYSSKIQASAADLLAERDTNDRQRADAIASLIAESGDATRGEEVFLSRKAACSACHRVGDRGERIGPELSRIGEIRTTRDLAEAILYPSLSLARGYESYTIVTADGQSVSGLLQQETAATVTVRTTDRAEIRVPREQIEELAPHATSIMPQGLDKVLSTAELRDLLAYLGTLK